MKSVISLKSSGETRQTFHKNILLLSFRRMFVLEKHCIMFSLEKHFIMYLLNNKKYLRKKIIRRKIQVAKHELIVLNLFSERVKILQMLFTKNTVKPV